MSTAHNDHPRERVSSSPGEFPLSQLLVGQRARVVSINGGRGLISRMATLGLTPGVELTLLQNYGHGPLLVNVRGGRVALGRGEAHKIWVQAL